MIVRSIAYFSIVFTLICHTVFAFATIANTAQSSLSRRRYLVRGGAASRMPPMDNDDDNDLSGIENMNMEELMARLGTENGGNSPQLSGVGPNYKWEQNTNSMLVSIYVTSETLAKDVHVIYPTTRKVCVKVQDEVILEGDLCGKIDREESFWILEPAEDETQMIISLEMTKCDDESGTNWSGFLANEGDPLLAEITDRVFFDIEAAGERLGRIELGLFGKQLPLTVANFKALCTDHSPNYKNSPFHRIIPKFMAQGGDITKGDGSGGTSIYGDSFDDEAFIFRHSAPGVLSMANAGPNSQSSQFFITYEAAPWLDNKHVVFGRLLAGEDILNAMESRGSTSGEVVDGPVVIADCGLL